MQEEIWEDHQGEYGGRGAWGDPPQTWHLPSPTSLLNSSCVEASLRNGTGLEGNEPVSSSKKSGPRPFLCSPWGIKASVINGVLTQGFWSVQVLMPPPQLAQPPQPPRRGLE